jgi:hypothetical protein
MLDNQVFYHGSIRNTIVAFGTLFSNIYIDRKAEGSVEGTTIQRLQIPISYAPKEKWIVRIDSDPNLNQHTYTTLPRMSFEINAFNYDATRKTNRNNTITCAKSDGTITRTYAPVPYNIDINLYVLTKTQEDGMQIIEQILPYFAPEFTMSIKMLAESNVITDVPIILNSLDINDEYDGDFQTRRFVTHTLGFTLKTWMFGPVTEHGIVNKVFINTADTDNIDTAFAKLDITGDITTGNTASNWDENLS